MTNHLPLNGTGITNKVSRSLTGAGLTPATSPAQGLAAALAGNTSQPDPSSTVDGTGSPDPAPTKAPATDPSQGRTGHAKPKDNRDPLLVAFQHVLNF